MNKRVAIAVSGMLAVGGGVLVGVGLSASSGSAARPAAHATASAEARLAPHRAPTSARKSPAAATQARPARFVAVQPAFLPDTYRVLLTRSIFSSNGQTARGSGQTATGAGLALRGIMQQGAGFIAFIGDGSGGNSKQVQVGDALAGGTVTAIDLHGLELATGGRTTRIEVGQTLGGGLLAGAPALPAVAALSPRLAVIRYQK